MQLDFRIYTYDDNDERRINLDEGVSNPIPSET